jgi:hypothetical protein
VAKKKKHLLWRQLLQQHPLKQHPQPLLLQHLQPLMLLRQLQLPLLMRQPRLPKPLPALLLMRPKLLSNLRNNHRIRVRLGTKKPAYGLVSVS